jgi:hypothetical protein
MLHLLRPQQHSCKLVNMFYISELLRAEMHFSPHTFRALALGGVVECNNFITSGFITPNSASAKSSFTAAPHFCPFRREILVCPFVFPKATSEKCIFNSSKCIHPNKEVKS